MSTKTQVSQPAAAAGSGALFGFFKVRPCRNGVSGFIAWGALERLTADDRITEPAEPVHFIFAGTEDEAVQKLTDEMDAAYGKRRWWQQHCTPNDKVSSGAKDQ